MIHPETEHRTAGASVGHGVFATTLIPMGTIVYVKDPLEIHVSVEEYAASAAALRRLIERYSYTEPTGVRVLSWDAAKYVNHSCEPNTMSTAWGLELAVRDIQAGEEITDEYGLFNLSKPMVCACRKPRCRGVIRATDMDTLSHEWDETVRAALEHAPRVSQPLLAFLSERDADEVRRCLSGAMPYCSVQTLRVQPPSAPLWRKRRGVVAS